MADKITPNFFAMNPVKKAKLEAKREKLHQWAADNGLSVREEALAVNIKGSSENAMWFYLLSMLIVVLVFWGLVHVLSKVYETGEERSAHLSKIMRGEEYLTYNPQGACSILNESEYYWVDNNYRSIYAVPVECAQFEKVKSNGGE